MTNGMRLRRLMRAQQRRRARYRAHTAYTPRGRAQRAPESPRERRRLAQTAVCGLLFVVLIGLKLVIPGNLAEFRGTLGQWLVRDADFAEAFRAIGHAFSGSEGLADSLDNAYVSVFGNGEPQEVMGDGDKEILDLTPDFPEGTQAEQSILGFVYSSPLAGVVTSAFGWREDPNGKGEAFHYGLDIAAEEGCDIACFAEGTVGVVGQSTELGKYVTVLHEDGFSTLYAHCSRITAVSGQKVAMGEKIAEVGATGNATGAHLHFEVHEGELYLNPIYYVADA